MKKSQEVKIAIKAKIVGGWVGSGKDTGGSWRTENTPFHDLGSSYTSVHFMTIHHL